MAGMPAEDHILAGITDSSTLAIRYVRHIDVQRDMFCKWIRRRRMVGLIFPMAVDSESWKDLCVEAFGHSDHSLRQALMHDVVGPSSEGVSFQTFQHLRNCGAGAAEPPKSHTGQPCMQDLRQPITAELDHISAAQPALLNQTKADAQTTAKEIHCSSAELPALPMQADKTMAKPSQPSDGASVLAEEDERRSGAKSEGRDVACVGEGLGHERGSGGLEAATAKRGWNPSMAYLSEFKSQLKAFHEKHGRAPVRGKTSTQEEKRLAKRLQNAKICGEKQFADLLCAAGLPSQSAPSEVKTWCPSDMALQDLKLNLQAFYNKHQRAPKRNSKSCPEENKLAARLCKVASKSNLSDQRLTELYSIIGKDCPQRQSKRAFATIIRLKPSGLPKSRRCVRQSQADLKLFLPD